MIADGRDLYQLRHAPWTSVFPGLAIGAAVLGFNLLGDALRDALDPRASDRDPEADLPTRTPMSYDVEALRRARVSVGRRRRGDLSQSRVHRPAPASAPCARSPSGAGCAPTRIALPHELQFGTLDRSRELIARLIGADAVRDRAGDEHDASASTSRRSRCR